MSDAIILICTIVGTLLAYLGYKAATSDLLKESIKLLQEKFEFLKRENTNLIDDLSKYGEANQSFENIFMQGLTLRQCIEILQKVKTEILTDEHYNIISKSKSKLRLDDMIRQMDIQIKHHMEIQTIFNYYINPKQ